jgi:hypothetical protein
VRRKTVHRPQNSTRPLGAPEYKYSAGKGDAHGICRADEARIVVRVRKRPEVRRAEHGLRGRAGDQRGDECKG